MNVLEIAVDGPLNESLYFAPMQEGLRGSFNLLRCKNRKALNLIDRYPESIPGQRLSFNLDTGEAEIIDGIHEDETVRDRLAPRFRFPEHRRPLGVRHKPTMLFWMKRAVESGVAKVTKGTLPEKIEGKPQLSFISNTHEVPDTNATLTAAIAEQTEAMKAMASAFTALANKLTK